MTAPAATTPDAPLVVATREGLYVPAAEAWIDPLRPVPRAILTHAHADHARPGMGEYVATRAGLGLLRWRLGEQRVTALEHGEPLRLGRARVSLHPAGHVLGSAQVRIEVDGRTWVASGDYKRQPDPTCAPFEVVPCEVFITEATFGLPVYRWPDTADVADDILAWVDACAATGEAAVLLCYALGKAQRVLAELALACARAGRPPIEALLHGAVVGGVEAYREAGVALPPTRAVADLARGEDVAGRLVLAPPSAAGTPWMKRFPRARLGFASGWMRVRGQRRRQGLDRGFVISDHADWPALLQTVEDTGARRVFAIHGATDAIVQALAARGVEASALPGAPRTDA